MLNLSTFVFSLIVLSAFSGIAFLLLLVIGSVNSRFEEEHLAAYWVDTPSTEAYHRHSGASNDADDTDEGWEIEKAA